MNSENALCRVSRDVTKPEFGVWFAHTHGQRQAGQTGSALLGTASTAAPFQPIESREVKMVGKLPLDGRLGHGQRCAANGKVLGNSRRQLQTRGRRG